MQFLIPDLLNGFNENTKAHKLNHRNLEARRLYT